jgi:hypothetical protein
MPVRRTQLNREQKARYLAGVQDLRAAGLECEVPNELQQSSRSFDIFAAPPSENILCELPSGVTAYAIWVRLLARVSNLILESVTIESAWDPESITLWRNQRGLYRVGQAISLTEEDVLNHRIENGLHLHSPGDIAEGWVVASGFRPIPDKYRSWMITRLSLTFTDQFGHDHSVQAEATLQRGARLRDSDSRARKTQGRFEVGRDENEIRVS